MLFSAEDLACAANLQVSLCQLIAAALSTDGPQSFQPFSCLRHRAFGIVKEQRICIFTASADPTAYLMHLCQTEMPDIINDECIGARYVETAFDDSRANKDLDFSVIKLVHDALKVSLSHLAVRDRDAVAGKTIRQTSRNLEDLMRRKLFREDLYYRLSVFPISLPPLARRADDIIRLAQHFLGRASSRYGKSVQRISNPAVSALLAYSWPGNVRELENCIERGVLTATDGCIHSYNLPPALQLAEFEESPFEGGAGLSLDEQLKAYERRVLEDALRRHGGNRSAAGRELGISPRMMTYRLSRVGAT